MLRLPSRHIWPGLLVAALLAASGSAWPQPRPVRFDRLSLGQGLSNETVTAMIQDREGFLWFGTEDGLNRYDGYAFTVFRHDPDDSTSISQNFISALWLDPSGALWVRTTGGMDRYDRARNRFVREGGIIRGLEGLGGTTVTAFLFDRSGMLWLGTEGRGVYVCDPVSGSSRRFRTDSGWSSDGFDVRALCRDSADRIWVGSSASGIAVISADRHSVTMLPRTTGSTAGDLGQVASIAADPRGNVWVATSRGMVGCFPGGVPGAFTAYPGAAHSLRWILSMLPDSRGTIWLGTFDGGLVAYDPQRGVSARYQANPYDPRSIPGDRIYSIFEDRSGSVWFGTWKGGIGAFHPHASKFDHMTHTWYDTTSLSDLTVWSIVQDRSGTLWFGTEQGGVNRLDSGSRGFRHYLHRASGPGSLSSNSVKALAVDSSGTLWVGTMDDGLNRYDRAAGRFVTYRHRAGDGRSLAADRVTALCVAGDGQLWVGGTFLDRYDRAADRFVHYDTVVLTGPLFRGSEIQAIVEDRAGRLWVGGFPGGLVRYERGTGAVRHYEHPSSIYDLHVDDAGTLWVSAFGNGLYRYDAGADSFQRFSIADGLPSNFVKAIESDARGMLWLGTSNGLSRFDPASRTARNYDPADGVQAFEFRTGSSYRTRDGRLFFGGVNGFNAFHPDSVRDNDAVPPVVITSFKIFDTPAALPEPGAEGGREIRLQPGADFFSFEFVALDFSSPLRNKYAYRMEGLDPGWVYSGSRRYASYAHLEPGEYVFRVKGSNGDGVWNEAGASVRLVILPPFWSTWWFRAGLVLVIGGLAYAAYRYRLARLLAVERTRASIATDLHDDIGTTLTNIALLSDLARREIASGQPEVMQRLEKISAASRSLMDAMNDIVWSIKPENDALEKTILRMEDYAVEILEEHGIDLHVDVPDRLKSLRLPMAGRRNLFFIFKEAIANVLKHSGATRVDVAVSSTETGGRMPQLFLSIADNGRGFDTSEARRGNGLQNMASRARLLSGTVTVVSAPGGGTRLELRFPLRSPG